MNIQFKNITLKIVVEKLSNPNETIIINHGVASVLTQISTWTDFPLLDKLTDLYIMNLSKIYNAHIM